jgi:hypothetical protein
MKGKCPFGRVAENAKNTLQIGSGIITSRKEF